MKPTYPRLLIPSGLLLLVGLIGPPFVSMASAVLTAVYIVAWTISAIRELKAREKGVSDV